MYLILTLGILAAAALPPALPAARTSVQAPAQATPVGELATAIRNLGSFDFATRTGAARQLRRMSPATTVPALEEAARSSADEYVRFRALVLLSAMDTTTTGRLATELMADRNDRLRTVAYQWFERYPQAAVLPRLIAALDSERSEFVRPALTRAIAAQAGDPRAQAALAPLVLRGEDQFRGTVITALGEYGGTFASADITSVARLDGPLQDDAVTALGRLGDVSARAVLGELQKSGPPDLQPTVSAAVCLMKIDCPARLAYIVDTLKFAMATEGQQPLLAASAYALSALAQAGHQAAVDALVDAGLSATGAASDSITLAVGTMVLRNPELALASFAARDRLPAVASLFRDAFDMLSEDFEEERFSAEIRRALYAAPEGSPRREAARVLLDTLEF